MTQEGYRVLTEAERGYVLRQVVEDQVNAKQQTIMVTHTTGYVGMTGGMTATSVSTPQTTGPKVMQWGNTWASVAFGNWVTHPAVFMLYTLVSVFTCGFFLPFFFYKTFKRPPLYLLSIDEYGRATWTQRETPKAQIVIRWVVGGALFIWAIMLLNVIGSLGQA